MENVEKQFLRKKFSDYYKSVTVTEPPNMSMREFGYGTYESKIAQRHLAFNSSKEFNEYLRNDTPFYVSYSGAYYKFPGKRPMKVKELQRADLFYEFDADDLETECKESHDSWKCAKCNAKGKGDLSNCPECGESVSVSQWVCPECLGAVKEQTYDLLAIMKNDFGFSEGIAINASGHKGYHIHIRADAISNLSKEARIELVDYLTFNGLDLEQLGFFAEKKKGSVPKRSEAKGVARRLLNKLTGFVSSCSEEELAIVAGISFSQAKRFLQKRPQILDSLTKGILYPAEKKNKEFWDRVLESMVSKISLNVDRQTSVDLHKILRVPMTIHGGTGLLAQNVALQDLKNFDPLKDNVVFGHGTQKVFVYKAPKFYLGGEWFGPFAYEWAELPEFVAIYLIAKKTAYLERK